MKEGTEQKESKLESKKLTTKILTIIFAIPVITLVGLLIVYLPILQAQSMPLEKSYALQNFLIKFCMLWLLVDIGFLAYVAHSRKPHPKGMGISEFNKKT